MLIDAVVRLGARVLRTRALLTAESSEIPLRELGRVIYGSVALGYVVSPIAGSIARVFALQHRGVTMNSAVAAQLWEKVVTGCVLAVFAAAMLLGDLPDTVR